MRRTLILLCCLLITTLTGCPMKSTLPRNMELKAFDPHRQDFACVHEADQVPPIDPQAEAWFQEGMRITSRDLPPNQRNYTKAAELWQQAADKQHWKAILNLAGLLIEGDGYAPYEIVADPERAVRLVEQGMQLGIPSAFDLMGSLHQKGAGVNCDASRAYAFWELAAYKGSPGAQTFLGKALSATYDNPQEGFWGNATVGRKMLECAFAQGYGKAALRLGISLDNIDKNYSRALNIFHEGVKMGCEDCANYLSSSFSRHDAPLTNNFVDFARSERYSTIGNALYHNPDLKFPNLDKVLPLPPAQLPVWNGNKEDLVNAAKAVVTPPPKLPPHPGSSRNNTRYYIPPGMTLPAKPIEVLTYWPDKAPRSGYWLLQLPDDPVLADKVRQLRTANELSQSLAPRYYRAHEDLGMPSDWTDWGGGVQQAIMAMLWWDLSPNQRLNSRWLYFGEAIPLQQPALNPLVARQLALCIAPPEQQLSCHGEQTCPQTGIWQSSLADTHPYSKRWAALGVSGQQAYVQAGQRFPVPPQTTTGAETLIQVGDLRWQWLGAATANAVNADGNSVISLPAVWQKQG